MILRTISLSSLRITTRSILCVRWVSVPLHRPDRATLCLVGLHYTTTFHHSRFGSGVGIVPLHRYSRAHSTLGLHRILSLYLRDKTSIFLLGLHIRVPRSAWRLLKNKIKKYVQFFYFLNFFFFFFLVFGIPFLKGIFLFFFSFYFANFLKRYLVVNEEEVFLIDVTLVKFLPFRIELLYSRSLAFDNSVLGKPQADGRIQPRLEDLVQHRIELFGMISLKILLHARCVRI